MKKITKNFNLNLYCRQLFIFLQKVIFFFLANINLCVRECYSILQLPQKTYKGEIKEDKNQTKM